MRRRLKKRNKRSVILFNILILLLSVAVTLVFFDTRVRPVIKRKVRDCARTDSTRILNYTLYNQIEDLDIKYSDLVNINYGANGEITSIQVNTPNVNKFKARFAISVSDALKEIERFDFSLKLGTLLGPEIMTERGPKIHFRVSSSGYVQTEILSRFEAAGINQTVHKILLDVSVNIVCYFPGYSTSVTVASELLLAETVVVGTVPNYYRAS